MFNKKKELQRLQAENARLRAALENGTADASKDAPRRSAEFWYSPAGYSWSLCDDILSGVHCLIAGTTGCGKSTLVNSIIFSALLKSPAETRFILCDPKRVELARYKNLPHVLRYAADADAICDAIDYTIEIMERRFKAMEADRVQQFTSGPKIYVIIDELADMMLSPLAKRFTRSLQRLLQLARAASISVIACTQAPCKAVIPAPIQLNMYARVGLHCLSSIESRQAIGAAGCENLPLHGIGYYVDGIKTVKTEIPLTPAQEIAERIEFWESQV